MKKFAAKLGSLVRFRVTGEAPRAVGQARQACVCSSVGTGGLSLAVGGILGIAVEI